MPAKRITHIFKELSFAKKLLGLGSFLMIISVFMPWYQDIDAFKKGVIYLGISGPLYFAGITLLALGAFSIALLAFEYNNRKLRFMPMKNPTFFMSTGIFSFYMLILVNSVYFHPDFGFNIPLKESQFGMFVSFIASSLITIGGYLSGRDRQTVPAIPTMSGSVQNLHEQLNQISSDFNGGIKADAEIKDEPFKEDVEETEEVFEVAQEKPLEQKPQDLPPYSGGPEMIKKFRQRSAPPLNKKPSLPHSPYYVPSMTDSAPSAPEAAMVTPEAKAEPARAPQSFRTDL